MVWTQKISWQRLSVYALGSVLILTGVLWWWTGPINGTTHTITKTTGGFSPSELHIEVGDTVVFINESGADMWPASDSHPSHGVYPEFDSLRPILPDESWEFVFERPGSWEFHDHLFAHESGKVVVAGSGARSIDECLSLSNDTIQPQCWEAEVETLAKAGGLAAAFDAVRAWYREGGAFQRNCHDVMHIIGEEAYRLFLGDNMVTDRSEVSYCGYGFFHGFVEAMLHEEGFTQFDRVKSYCESVREHGDPQSIGPCYHGIGHAVFDSLDSSFWGNPYHMNDETIRVCEKLLKDPFERTRCVSGAHNALANALSARDYDLTFDGWVAHNLCDSQKVRYQPFCFMELGNGHIRDLQLKRKEELAYIRNMPEGLPREMTLIGFMDTEVRRHIDTETPNVYTQICESFSRDSEVRACIDGTLIGLRGIGEPGNEHEKINLFCDAFAGFSHREYCENPEQFDF